MQFVLLISESPEAFAARNDAEADPLEGAVTATIPRITDGKRHAQDGSNADGKGQQGGSTILEVLSLDAALDWAARCPAASYGAVEVRPPSPELRCGGEE